MSYVVKTIALSFIIQTAISDCERKRIIHTIRFPECQHKRILSFGCAGTCNSYSETSSTESGVIVRHCECCQENDKILRQARIICRNEEGNTPFNYVVVSLAIPTSCSCRSCSPLPQHDNPGEPDIFNLEKEK